MLIKFFLLTLRDKKVFWHSEVFIKPLNSKIPKIFQFGKFQKLNLENSKNLRFEKFRKLLTW